MHVSFQDDTQRQRYAVLSQRPMAPTRYPDQIFMEALGFEANIKYLCNQLKWDEYADDLNVTYRNLTLEFLSSFEFEPYNGQDGYLTFRLFGIEYCFTQREFGDLLGFQTTPDAIPELPVGYFMTRDIEKFWRDITAGGSLDPSTQLSPVIHNPAFRYFQMVIAHTFLGKADTDTHVSEEEIFFLYCATQSRPVACGNFLLWNLMMTSKSAEGILHVGGTVTQIASALGHTSKLSHLTSYCGYTTMDIDFYLDRGLMRRVYFNPNQYRLLIDNETVHYFTLPDPMMTNVHNPANWTYALEGLGETVDERKSPPIPEYHPCPSPERTTVFSNNFSLQQPDIYAQVAELHREVAQLRQTVEDLSLQVMVSDATHSTEADLLQQEIDDLRSKLVVAHGSKSTKDPTTP